MQHMLQSLEREPAQILGSICQEYEKINQPVPDHHLHLSGYIGEASLRALTSAGLVKAEPGGRLSLFQYKPTKKGMEQYKHLLDDGFYQKAH